MVPFYILHIVLSANARAMVLEHEVRLKKKTNLQFMFVLFPQLQMVTSDFRHISLHIISQFSTQTPVHAILTEAAALVAMTSLLI